MDTLIVTGGNIDISFIKEHLNKYKYDNIIAVDKGLELINILNIIPNHIVGDFDSVNHNIIKYYQTDKSITFHKYNAEKDYTDTDIAIKLAITLKSKSITIIGGIGTRFDHSLANIHILCNALKSNIPTKIIDRNNVIYLISNKISLQRKKVFGKYISLIPLTTSVKDLCLTGFKYPLYNYNLTIGTSLGISNEIIDEIATIDFKDGILIVIESAD